MCQSKPQYLASRSLSFHELALTFLKSRGILCISAVALGIVLRVALKIPPTWIELGLILVLLSLWSRIELKIHHWMHHAEGSPLYVRHQWHHENPHDDLSLGPLTTTVWYNLIPFVFFYLKMPIASSAFTTVLIAITIYEFVHFTTHFRYRPVTQWGKRVRRNHLLHHKHPHQYMGVVFPQREPAAKAESKAA